MAAPTSRRTAAAAAGGLLRRRPPALARHVCWRRGSAPYQRRFSTAGRQTAGAARRRALLSSRRLRLSSPFAASLIRSRRSCPRRYEERRRGRGRKVVVITGANMFYRGGKISARRSRGRSLLQGRDGVQGPGARDKAADDVAAATGNRSCPRRGRVARQPEGLRETLVVFLAPRRDRTLMNNGVARPRSARDWWPRDADGGERPPSGTNPAIFSESRRDQAKKDRDTRAPPSRTSSGIRRL